MLKKIKGAHFFVFVFLFQDREERFERTGAGSSVRSLERAEE